MVAFVVVLLNLAVPKFTVLILVAPPFFYGLVATAFAVCRGHSYHNELPNVLRVFLGSLGASLFFSQLFLGYLIVLLGVFMNDEMMRRVFHQKGVIVFSGVDGTGKSTHAGHVCLWLRSKGFECSVVHFDKYLFLKRKSKSGVVGRVVAKTNRFSFARPYLACVDNFCFYLLKVLPHVVRGRFVVCDRFVWDNYVKHVALGYGTRFLFRFATLLKPSLSIFLDISPELAVRRVDMRGGNHLRYTAGQYEVEREMFHKIIVRLPSCLVLDTDESVGESWGKIESYLTENLGLNLK